MRGSVRAIERASTFVFSRPALSCLTRRSRVGSTTRAGVLIDEWVEDAAGSGLGDNDPLSHSSAIESDDLRSTSRLAFAARNVRGDHSRPDRCRDVTVAARHTFPHGDASQQRTFHGVTVNDLAFGEPRVGAATAHRGLWSGKNAEDGAAETLILAATRRTTRREKNARATPFDPFVTTNRASFIANPVATNGAVTVAIRSSSVHEGGQPSTVGRKVSGPHARACDAQNADWTLRGA